MPLPESITALITALNRLPGIGPRSAERIALHLVQSETDSVKQLASAILVAREKIQFCSICGALTEKSPCPICDDSRRDASLVCIVEQPVDILSIEKSGTYRGKFHVLGGKISPLDGVEPEDLRIAELEKRLSAEPIKEIVIALGTDVEG
ncbi:MAG: recombination protein RecR, partial [Verrucomicrobiota bacterium]